MLTVRSPFISTGAEMLGLPLTTAIEPAESEPTVNERARAWVQRVVVAVGDVEYQGPGRLVAVQRDRNRSAWAVGIAAHASERHRAARGDFVGRPVGVFIPGSIAIDVPTGHLCGVLAAALRTAAMATRARVRFRTEVFMFRPFQRESGFIKVGNGDRRAPWRCLTPALLTLRRDVHLWSLRSEWCPSITAEREEYGVAGRLSLSTKRATRCGISLGVLNPLAGQEMRRKSVTRQQATPERTHRFRTVFQMRNAPITRETGAFCDRLYSSRSAVMLSRTVLPLPMSNTSRRSVGVRTNTSRRSVRSTDEYLTTVREEYGRIPSRRSVRSTDEYLTTVREEYGQATAAFFGRPDRLEELSSPYFLILRNNCWR